MIFDPFNLLFITKVLANITLKPRYFFFLIMQDKIDLKKRLVEIETEMTNVKRTKLECSTNNPLYVDHFMASLGITKGLTIVPRPKPKVDYITLRKKQNEKSAFAL